MSDYLKLGLISSIFIISSLTEKFEFIVHNEEVLLFACFVSFVWSAHAYLSIGISEDFQKKVQGLEDQFFSVISEKFSGSIAYFDELFMFKGLEAKLLIVKTLVFTRLFSHFTNFQITFWKDTVNLRTSARLMEILRAENKIIEEVQLKSIKSIIISLILPKSSFDYLKSLKQVMVAGNIKHFFLKVSFIAKLA